jgi:serine/threonine protein kinase
MSTAAPAIEFDPERTRPEGGGAAGAQVGGFGRGTVLAGKYRLEMLLGEGGMACVWSAYHLELELPVAIKLLRSGANCERLAERLRLEARAAARLVHPSIVRVLDVALTERGEPFIVMELLNGENLAQLLARGRLQANRAVQLLLPIAEALAIAHEHGIVHRDLKPDNVFVSSEEQHLQPKLLDFGIAKLAYASALARRLTDRGVVLGSPHYMSPEQVRGEDVDYRSDIWSFCVVLFKALTGAAPFNGSSERAIMDAITTQPLARDALVDVDEELARIVRWGLQKEPLRRPASMRELGRHLAEWLMNRGVSNDASGAPLVSKWLAQPAQPIEDLERTEPSRRSQRARQDEATQRIVPVQPRRWPVLLAALVFLLGGGLAWHSWGRGEPVTAAPPPLEATRVAAPVPVAPVAPVAPPVSEPAPPPETVQASTAPAGLTGKRSAKATRPRPTPSSRLPF